VEAGRALLEHKRPQEAEPFAPRAASLDPSPENEELLQRVLEAVAAAPPAATTEAAELVKEDAAVEPADTPGQPGLFSRLFRRG